MKASSDIKRALFFFGLGLVMAGGAYAITPAPSVTVGRVEFVEQSAWPGVSTTPGQWKKTTDHKFYQHNADNSDSAIAVLASGVLPVATGGTALSSTPSNGQLLIGNGTGYTLAAPTASSPITVTTGSGTLALSIADGAIANTKLSNAGFGVTTHGGISGSSVSLGGSLDLSTSAGGDASGSLDALTVAKINGSPLGTTTGASTGQILGWNGSAYAPLTSIGALLTPISGAGGFTFTALSQGALTGHLTATSRIYADSAKNNLPYVAINPGSGDLFLPILIGGIGIVSAGSWSVMSSGVGVVVPGANFLGPFSPNFSNMVVSNVACNWGVAGVGGTTGVVVQVWDNNNSAEIAHCTVGACTTSAGSPVTCNLGGASLPSGVQYVVRVKSGAADCATYPSNVVCTVELSQ